MKELYVAREILSSQGKRTDLTSGQMSQGWDNYCQDIGIEKRTANRWLNPRPIAHIAQSTGENELEVEIWGNRNPIIRMGYQWDICPAGKNLGKL